MARPSPIAGEPSMPEQAAKPCSTPWKASVGISSRFKTFEMQSRASRKSSASRFEDKTDEEIDAGFDFLQHEALTSSSEMQQLRWTTKQLN